MSRFTRVLAWAFPRVSASYANQARILAAMEGRAYQTPAPVTSTPAGAGQTTVAPSAPGVDALRPGPDQTPEGEGEGVPRQVAVVGASRNSCASPSGPPFRRSSDQIAVDLITWGTPS